MVYRIITFLSNNFEALFWVAAMVVLFFMPAAGGGPTLCPLHWLGFRYCPGCGIGHAIHYALHLQFAKSFQAHPAGIAAVIIVLVRVKQLVFKPKYYPYEQS
jgi:hypothetical protein